MGGECNCLKRYVICVVVIFIGVVFSTGDVEKVDTQENSIKQLVTKCPESDNVCLNDQLGYEAIKQLHRSIDDDNDGNLDRSESDEFLRDELKYEDGFDRHSQFHGSDDNITVNDLWKLWIHSPVYNWTVDDVVEWLDHAVELPQYSETFRINAVEGRILPRIAVNGKYMLNILGIKNPIDKQKLAVKAQDLVLFGPPKLGHNYMKDLLLVFFTVVAIGGCWLLYMQNKYSQEHLKKVMKDLDTLQKQEDALSQLQLKLDEAHKEKEDVAEEKKSLELKMEDEILNAKQEADQLRRTRECTEEEIGRLKLAEQELEKLKRALERAEYELKHRPNAPLGELQQWLQLTYEVESKHYDAKREAAEKQLYLAKEMCEKIRRKRGAFLGSLRVAHTTSVDDTDHSISCARSALEEVKTALTERTHRWRQIEAICGFSIIANPGYDHLDSLLRSPMGSSVSTTNLHNLVSPLNVDEADEDIPPGAVTQTGMRRNKTESSIGAPGMNGSTYGLDPSTLTFRTRDGATIPIRSRDGSAISGYPPSHGVWPQLMRAGMQLTMLGFDLTDPSLRAMHPLPAVAEFRERKGHSLHDSQYGGSHDSLHSTFNNVIPTPSRNTAFRPVHASTPTSHIPSNSVISSLASGLSYAPGSNTHTLPSNQTLSGDSGRGSEEARREGSTTSDESCAAENAHQTPSYAQGRVEFGLHEVSDVTQNPVSAVYYDDPRIRAQSFNQSQSLEQKSAVVRPRALPTSLSEGALSGLPAQTGSGNRRVVETPETLDEEVGSSLDESMDSLNNSDAIPGAAVAMEKRKKNKGIRKFFTKKSKQKTS